MAIVSLRGYSRHRGVSLKAIQKAIESGRIRTLPDGKIETEEADRDWARNTGPRAGAKPPEQPRASPITQSFESPRPDGGGLGGLDYGPPRAREIWRVAVHQFVSDETLRSEELDCMRIPAKPITDSNLMAIRIPMHADHYRSEATRACFMMRK